jgi:ribosome-binding factor A
MGKMPFSRSARLASSVQKDLSQMIITKKLKEFRDPRFQGLISITDVRVTNGYQHLDIFLSVFEEDYRAGVLEVFKEAIPSIRGEICRGFKLRIAPSLAFYLDESLERGNKIWNLLDNLETNE